MQEVLFYNDYTVSLAGGGCSFPFNHLAKSLTFSLKTKIALVRAVLLVSNINVKIAVLMITF